MMTSPKINGAFFLSIQKVCTFSKPFLNLSRYNKQKHLLTFKSYNYEII